MQEKKDEKLMEKIEPKKESFFKKYSKFFKILGLLILFLFTIFLVGLAYLFFNLYFNNKDDKELLDNSHLMPKITRVSDSENGYFDLKKATEKIYHPFENDKEKVKNLLEGNDWDEEFVKDLLEKNKEAFVEFEKVLNKGVLVDPEINNLNLQDINVSHPNTDFFNDFRKINNLYLISIKNDLENNRKKEALEKINLELDFFEKSKKQIFGYLGYYFIEIDASNNLYSIIEKKLLSLNKDEFIQLQNKLEKQKENREVVVETLKMEYLIFSNEFLNIDKNVGEEFIKEKKIILGEDEYIIGVQNYYVKIYKTVNALTKRFETRVNNSYLECNNLIEEEKTGYSSSVLKSLFTENFTGKMLTEMVFMQDFTTKSIHLHRCSEDFRIISLQVQLASQSYKNENGNYPETIEILKNSGYLISDIPQQIHGWNLDYDSNSGKIKKVESVKY